MADCITQGTNYGEKIDNVLDEISQQVDVFHGDADKLVLEAQLTSGEFLKELTKFARNNKDVAEIFDSRNVPYNDFRKITISDLEKIIQVNQVKKFIKDYYINSHPSVNNSTTDGIEFDTVGFTSGKIKNLAYKNVAQTILRTHVENMSRPIESRRDKDGVMAETVQRLTDEFFDNIVQIKLNNKGKKLDRIPTLVSAYKQATSSFNSLASAIKKNIDEINRLKELGKNFPTKFKEFTQEQLSEFNKYKNKIAELERTNIDLKNQLTQKYNTRFILGYAIIQNVADSGNSVDIRAKNWANMIYKLRSDYYGFIRRSLSIGGYQELLKEYSDTLNETDYKEFQDNNIVVDEEYFKIDDSRDTTTKNWNDALPRDFNSLVKTENELYLRAIPKLNSVIEIKDNNRLIDYDTNNDLGINEFMDYDVVKNNIISNVDISSREAFLDSLMKRATSVPELAGLSKIYYDCIDDPILLNRLMKQFEYHLYEKTRVSTINGNSINRSNNRSNNLNTLYWDLTNQVRFSKYHAYDSYNVNRLSPLVRLKVINGKLNDSKLFDKSTIKEGNTVFDDGVQLIKDMMLGVFNNFDTKIIDNYLNEVKTETEKGERLGKLATSVNRLYDEIKDWASIYADEAAKVKASQQLKVSGQDLANKSLYEIFTDESETEIELYEIDQDRINQANQRIENTVLSICQMMSEYSISKNEYTSIGVEGNRSSDVIKNSWISRFNDTMRYGTKEDPNKGVHDLINTFRKGDPDSNQYAYNPLLYGSFLYNDSGTVNRDSIVPGMFNKNTSKLHKNVRDFLVPRLFDGVDTGSKYRNVTYNSMSGNDYLITKFMNFHYPMYSLEGGIHHQLVTGERLANYFLRVPSDATHNYTVQYCRLSDIQIESALTSHLKQELCNFIANLANVFEFDKTKGVYKITTDKNKINRLFKFAHLSKNGNIVENKQLAGNFFNFIKFFNTGGKDYNDIIKRTLSLYGDGTIDSLIKVSRGKLYLDPNSRLFKLYINEINNGNDGVKRFQLKDSVELTKQLHEIVKEWKKDYLAEQKELLKDKLDRLRETDGYYSDESKTKENGKENKVVGDYTEKDIDDFLLNDLNMFMTMDEFFDGNGGYYKDAQDYLKRAKQVQAGGESYAIGDKFGSDFTGLQNIKAIGTQDNIKIVTKNGVQLNVGATDKPIEIRNGFRGIIIKNTDKPADRYQSYEDEMFKIFKDELLELNKVISNPLTEEQINDKARIRAQRSVSAFKGDTTVNDAQSYITLDEFIRRTWIDGTFNDYAPLFERLKDIEKAYAKVKSLRENGDAEQLKQASNELEKLRNSIDVAALGARIQVQKNFYFDHQFDEVLNNYYSRQIKNAEFVLIKGLLGEGSDLDKLYDLMIKNEIDQVNTAETSKASNRTPLVYWDNEGKVDEAFEKNLTSDSKYIENYYYKYLYKQQDNPQHMENARNKFGLQIQVKVPDNIKLDNEYVRDKLQNYFDAYRTKIEKSYNEMLNDMGYKYKDGKIVNISNESEELDPYDFYKLALEEATRLGVNSQFMEYLEPDPTTRHPKMPNYMNLVSTKIENVIQALYNSRITRQKMPGWHAVQVTSMGTDKKLQYHPEGWYNAKEHKYIDNDEYNELEDKTGWEKSNIPIIDIRIPRWDKSIPRDIPEAELIAKLKEAGLDQQIINRIPTEGKQSIAVARVVGFIDDIYGSTILLPDEWVTQTGADFDTDSVYSMYHHMRYDKKKKMFIKEKFFNPDDYKEEDKEKAFRKQYTKFVREAVREKIERKRITADDHDAKWKEAYDEFNNTQEKNELQLQFDSIEFAKSGKVEDEDTGELNVKKSGVYYRLPREAQDVLRSVKHDKSKYNGDRKASYKDRLKKEIDALIDYTKTTGKWTASIQKYINYCNDLLDIFAKQEELLSDRFELDDVKERYKELMKAVAGEVSEENFKAIQAKAAELGIVDFETFKTLPVEEMNTNKGLDNRVIDSLMDILKDPSSREENYATSNFIDISEAMRIMSDAMGMSSQLATMYDTNSQIRNFVNAMSGTKLKGMSVNLDTFLSKTSMGRARIGGDFYKKIRIKYDLTRKDDKGNTIYDKDAIKYSFGSENVEDHGDYIIVTHHNMGWSNDNKNVAGKIISMYSSETTAHTLDAMKVGSAYNVNEFTFKAYKLMPMVGSDYYTTMAFIYQPAISRLNVEHDKLNSAYNNSSGNEIRNATKNIIKEILTALDDKEGLKLHGYFDLIKYISTNEKVKPIFEQLLGTTIDGGKNTYQNVDKIFDISLMIERLNHVRDFNNEFNYKFNVDDGRDINDKLRDACIDLIMLSQYDVLSNLGNHINKIAQVSKPEKIGAAQTIYETKRIIRRINDITGRTELLRDSEGYVDSRSEDEIKEDKATAKCLLVDVKDAEGKYTPVGFLSALFPTESDNKTIIPENSFYPFIAQMYKSSTIASVEINSRLFRLEDEKYYRIIADVEQKIGRRLNPDQAREFKKYLMGYVYTRVPALALPLDIDENGKVSSKYGMDDLDIRDTEIRRVNGFATRSGSLRIKFVNNLTEAEIEEYKKLTPAQKVLFIQRSFREGKGIFGLISAESARPQDVVAGKGSGQRISFNDEAVDIETMFEEFTKSFSNKNPLIRLAAIDLVKYALLVENHNFGKNKVSKFIINDALYNGTNNYGLNVVEESARILDNEIGKDLISDEFIRRFIRSHSEIAPTVRIFSRTKNEIGESIPTAEQKGLEKCLKPANGIIIIPKVESKEGVKLNDVDNNIQAFREKIDEFGDKYINLSYRRYSEDAMGNAVERRANVLYEVRMLDDGTYFLIPHTRLDRNEQQKYSYVRDNNNRETYIDTDPATGITKNTANKFFIEEYYESIFNEFKKDINPVDDDGQTVSSDSKTVFSLIKKHIESVNKEIAKKVEAPKQIKSENDAVNDRNLLDKLSTNPDINRPYLKPQVDKFIEAINGGNPRMAKFRENKYGINGSENIQNKVYVYNVSPDIRNMFPVGKWVIQRIKDRDGNKMYVKIKKLEHSNVKLGSDKITNPSLMVAKDQYDRELKTFSYAKHMYIVKVATKDEIRELDKKNEVDDNATPVMMSVARRIEGRNYDATATDVFDKFMPAILNKISTDARRDDPRAIEFMDFVRQYGINTRLMSSVAKDAKAVYRNLDYYTRQMVNYYKEQLDKFKLSNEEIYSVDKEELYRKLGEADILDQQSDYNRLIKLLLDVKNIGEYYSTIGHLEGQDEINKYIDSIRANVDSLSVYKIYTAFDHLFNIYFAQFSTDPLIKEGIIKLREQFGDLNALDASLTDVTHIRSKEVQVVTKIINDTLARVERITAPRAQAKFETEYDNIIKKASTPIDFTKIIDKDGYFVKDYTEDFIKEKRRIDNELDAYVDENKRDSEGYYRKWIEKERFYINNVNREVVSQYYKDKVDNLERALNEGGNIFIEYKRLSRQLYDTVYDYNTDEESKRRANIQAQINELLEEYNEEAGAKKSDSIILKIRAVQEFRKREMEINKKYYDYQAYDGWKNDVEHYTNIIKTYDETHTLQPHDIKMKNAEYAEAWNWIHSNTYRTISQETKATINNLRRSVYGDADYKGSVARKLAKEREGVLGENNRMDARNFTEDDIRKIKQDFIAKHSRYSTVDGTNKSLLKYVPEQPILTDAFWNEFNKLYNPNISRADKHRTHLTINKIIEPYFDKNTGKLDTISLVKYLENHLDVYNELKNAYESLRARKGGGKQSRAFIEHFKNTMEMVYNKQAYDEEKAILDDGYNNISSTGKKSISKKAYNIWMDLFTVLDKDNSLVPRFEVFGYFKIKDEKYINKAKTEARDKLRRNVRYTPNEYYYDARAKAIAEGKYEQWFELNHVYNTDTGNWEPLRIWTQMELREDNEFGDEYQYVPTFDNSRKLVKDEFKNKNWKKGQLRYNSTTGNYNNGIQLTADERRMKEFLQETVKSAAYNIATSKAADSGMAPRMIAAEPWNTVKIAKEIANTIGLTIDQSWKLPNDNRGMVTYNDDRQVENGMLQLIKTKGWEKEKKIEQQTAAQTDEQYRQYVRSIQAENEEIRKRNLERERAVRSNDWRKVFSEFVKASTLFKGKELAKNTAHILLEELNMNNAYAISSRGGISRNSKESALDYNAPNTEMQRHIHDVVNNWTKRRIFDDYHDRSKARSFANSIQQFTSAKFMIGNMWSGITNVTMGWTNMAMETFAGEYFEKKDCWDASWEYAGGAMSYVQGLIGKERTRFTNKADALIHYFNVLEYDRLLERRDNENLDEYSQRLRKILYLNQSGGEHLMQNSVLLATLKGTRIWFDRSRNKAQLVSKQQLRYEYEHKALSKVLDRFPVYKQAFEAFKQSISENKYELFQYDKRKKDLASEFIRLIYNNDVPGHTIEKTIGEQIKNAFIEERKKAVEEADAKFETLNRVYDQIQFIDGKIEIKNQTDGDGNIITHSGDVGYLTEQLVGDIANRVISINKKIHGVYDKDGAAMLERKWYGSLLMQYHKHIWPGIMKHWRNRGYWNEYRGTRERGMYTDLFSYFSHSLHLVDEWKKSAKVPENGFVDNFVNSLKSLETIGSELKLNWQLMPTEQRNNMARIFGELAGLSAVFLTGMLVYSLYDDEEEVHNSAFASNTIYLADRLASEIIMYNGYGSWQEVQTLWSNPVAGGAFFADALKAATLTMEFMIDPDFDSTYDKGPYKGMSKWEVLVRRNFWLTRLGLRFTTIGANNKYYRIGNKSIVLNAAKKAVGFDNPNDEDVDLNTGTRFEQ